MGTSFPRDQGIPSVLNDSGPARWRENPTRGAGGRIFAPSPGSRHNPLHSRGYWVCPCSCRRPGRRFLPPCVHACARVRTCVCARVCMCARECVHVCARLCACVCASVYASVCMSVSSRGCRCERAVEPTEGGKDWEGRDGGSEPGRGCSVLRGAWRERLERVAAFLQLEPSSRENCLGEVGGATAWTLSLLRVEGGSGAPPPLAGGGAGPETGNRSAGACGGSLLPPSRPPWPLSPATGGGGRAGIAGSAPSAHSAARGRGRVPAECPAGWAGPLPPSGFPPRPGKRKASIFS